MLTHNITFGSFIPHGRVTLDTSSGELQITTKTAVNTRFQLYDNPIKHFASLEGTFKLPFRIDMTVKIDSPALYLIIGKGHVSFATGYLDNRRITDILGNDYKPNSHVFDNDLPTGEYVDISVTYGGTAMWVTVNDECRCFSKTDPYIKALKKNAIPEEFNDGFNFTVACDKRTRLTVKSMTVIEYEDEEPIAPAETVVNMLHNPGGLCVSEKPTLEDCIQGLSHNLQKEIANIDGYLMKDKKKTLRLKRKIDGGFPCGKISYVSPVGFSYHISVSNTYMWHDIGWIGYNTKREREKYGGIKKADYTIETLSKLAETSREFADEMFLRIKECVGCSKAGGNCMHHEKYEYNGKEKISCGGGMHFKMFPSDFEDLRKVVDAIDSVVAALNITK